MKVDDFREMLGNSGLMSLSMFAPIVALCGYASHQWAVFHNKKVDDLTQQQTGNFTQRIEQQKAAAAPSPSVPSR